MRRGILLTLAFWASVCFSAMRCPVAIAWLVRPFTQFLPSPFPKQAPSADFGHHRAILEASGISTQDALSEADRLLGRLSTMARSIQDACIESPSAKCDAALRSALKVFWTSSLLGGTGYKLESEIVLRGEGDVHVGWVSEQDMVRVSDVLARGYKLDPGILRVRPFLQRAPAAFRTLHRSDENCRELYWEQVRLFTEEHLHVIHHLRSYGGLRATAVNVSRWAVESGAPFTIAFEADAFAWMTENLRRLPPQWRSRYASRKACP